MTTTNYTVHGVLAGCYKGSKISSRSILTHASTDGGTSAICKRVKVDALCDYVEDGEPTCPVCRARLGLK